MVSHAFFLQKTKQKFWNMQDFVKGFFRLCFCHRIRIGILDSDISKSNRYPLAIAIYREYRSGKPDMSFPGRRRAMPVTFSAYGIR
jgi:hypothetical protein